MTSYEELEPESPRGWSPLAVALIATLVLLLGLGGALFGIYAANKNRATPQPTVTVPEAFPTLPSTTTPPATSTPPVTPTTEPPSDTFALPDLSGMDFQAARAKVRELKLGWRLVFEGADSDATVRASDPAAGAQVKKGATIKIFVKGAAPLATVPDVRGLTCVQAANAIVDSGLYPQYDSGRGGTVGNQTPLASDPQTLHWNDQVRITCSA